MNYSPIPVTATPKIHRISIVQASAKSDFAPSRQYLSFEEFKRQVDALAEIVIDATEEAPQIVLLDGEAPTSHPEFRRFVRYLSAKIPPRGIAEAPGSLLKFFYPFLQGRQNRMLQASLGLIAPIDENYYAHYELIQEVFGFQYLSTAQTNQQIDAALRPHHLCLVTLEDAVEASLDKVFDSRISPGEAENLQFDDWLFVWASKAPVSAGRFAPCRNIISNPGYLYFATDGSYWMLNRKAIALEGRKTIPLNLQELQRLYTRGKAIPDGNLLFLTSLPHHPLPVASSKNSQIIRYSFLIPVYNCADTIARCLLSIQAQSVQDYEIICCDDGSTDGTLAILREFEQRDSRIKVLCHGANQNAAISRFDLIDAAQGEYCAFVDADDTIAPDFLSVATNVLLTEERYDILEFPYEKIDNRGVKKFYQETKERVERGRDIFSFSLYAKGESTILWSKVIRTSLLHSIPQRRIRMRYANDTIIAPLFYFFANSYRFYNPGHPLYTYNYGAGGLGKTFSLYDIKRMSLCIRSSQQILSAFADFFEFPEDLKKHLIQLRSNYGFMQNDVIPTSVKPEERLEALAIFRQLTDDLYEPYR